MPVRSSDGWPSARGALAERHAVGVRSRPARPMSRSSRAARRYTVRGAAPEHRRGRATGRARDPGVRRDPAGHRPRLPGPRRGGCERGRDRARQQPVLGGRRGDRLRRDAARGSRICPATTPCRDGSRKSPGIAVRDLRRAMAAGDRRRRPARAGAARTSRRTAAASTSASFASGWRPARSVAANRRAELVVTGRVSARTLAWLERGVPARIRAIIEERGLRAAIGLPRRMRRRPPGPSDRARPPRSLLGALLERDGPGALGRVLAELGDAAIVDTRVLLAHRLGPDEAAWPGARGSVRLGPAAGRTGRVIRGFGS